MNTKTQLKLEKSVSKGFFMTDFTGFRWFLLMMLFCAFPDGKAAAIDAKSGFEMDGTTVIVGGKEAEAPEVFAAEELSKYLEKMAGIKLPIAKDNKAVSNENAILIGTLKSNDKIQEIVKKGTINTDKLNEQQDGFIIKTVDNNKLVLLGSNPQSVLYSVYALLERLGCLWPAPGEDFVPTLKPINIHDMDVVEKADLDFRMIFVGGRGEPGVDGLAWVDWLAKNRINWILYWWKEAGWGRWKNDNISSEVVKRGIKTGFGVDNVIMYFLPPGKYAKEHPEYYALIAGKRNPESKQLCVSNPEVIRIVAENIVEFIKTNPKVEMINLSPTDNAFWCECDTCRELDKPFIKDDNSNSHIYFQNEVLIRVNQAFPHVIFFSECYHQFGGSPARISLKNLNNNLFSWYANNNSRCTAHALWDKSCPINQQRCSGMEGWAKWYGNKKRVIPLESSIGRTALMQMPVPNLNTMTKDFPCYKDFGGVTVWCGDKAYQLNEYVAMQLAWNTNESLDKILSEYCNKYYGKAGDNMRAYFMKWENIAPKLGCFSHSISQELGVIDENDLKEWENHLTTAKQIPESKEVVARIRALEEQFNYIKLLWSAQNKMKMVLKYKKEGNMEQAQMEKEKLIGICGEINEHKDNCIVEYKINFTGEMLSGLITAFPTPYKGNLESEAQPDEHTTFLAHFNKTLDADVAKGDRKHTGNGVLTQNQDGKFGEGLMVPESGHVCYKANNGNINFNEGTIAFWIKPGLDSHKGRSFPVFTCMAADEAHPTGFPAITIAFDFNCVGFHTYDNKKNRILYFNVKMALGKKGEWHHFAVTWKGKERHIYLDGKEAAFSIAPEPIVGTPTEFRLDNYWGSTLDDLKILDVQ